MAADDRRSAGEVAEGDGPDDALGLADDVVVHHQRVRRGALAHRLELAPGVAAGAAEVALLDAAAACRPVMTGRAGRTRSRPPCRCPAPSPSRCRGRARSSSSVPIWVSSLAQKSGRFMVVIAMSVVPCSARSSGTSADHSADSTTASSSPATTLYQYQPPSMNGFSGRSKTKEPLASLPVVAEVDALRAAVGHRAVDDHRGAAAGEVDGQPDVGHDGPAPPVAGREGVEVGAEREPLAGLHPQRGARLDLLRVDGPAGGGGLPDGGVVEVLGRPAATDLVLVGVECDVLGVDVEREDVEVPVDRHDLALQHRRTVPELAHSSTPPLVRAAPSAKCGLSLLSNMDSAEPIAMCMSRYL